MSTAFRGEYTKEKTDKAFSVLLRATDVVHSLTNDYRIVGGWVPFLLCSEHRRLGPHVGSLDVDVLLFPGRTRLPALDALGNGLLKGDFKPEAGRRPIPNKASARWWAEGVRLDLLAPAPTRATSLTETFAADMKLCRFYGVSGAVFEPAVLEKTIGNRSIRMQVANGGAMLMAKTIACEERMKDVEGGKASKDAYDLYYILTSYRHGPDRLADELLANPEDVLRAEAMRILERDFGAPAAPGPGLVCAFLGLSGDDREDLQREVSNQVGAFLRIVRNRRPHSA